MEEGLQNIMTQYNGIDYGHGLTNIDASSGIRYGVINQHRVLQAWCDSSEPVYSDSDRDEIDDTAEPSAFVYNRDGYQMESDSYGDIFICKSPYYTYAQFCSPCAPGACHLEHPLDNTEQNNRCYCLGHDWFDESRASYRVFSVETGLEILPE